jgi:uncharacterized protein YraI
MNNLPKALGMGAVVALFSAGSALAAVAIGSVNVRTGPSVSFAKVDTLYRGERVSITDRAGGWCFVQKSGPDGWVSCRYLAGSGVVYRAQPSVRLSFGFGIAPRRMHHDWDDDWWDDDEHWSGPHHDDDGGHWSGPSSVTTYPDGGGSITIY